MSDFSLHGHDLFGEAIKPPSAGLVAERFIMPPFTVLDARQGEWQERKRQWIALGIKSELGRGGELVYTGAAADGFDHYRDKEKKLKLADSYGALNGENAPDYMPKFDTGTSIFDPVLCELLVSWFSGPGAQVIDPFAGGSVRGIVTGALGRNYFGCDLREEQILANREQAEAIRPPSMPQWVCGDSLVEMVCAPKADLVLSCPPYGDLEVYSDKPEDLSSMSEHEFARAYTDIIARTCERMKPNSFSAWVVGNYRRKDGTMIDLCGLTTRAHEEQDVMLYNEAVLVTAVGTAAFRVTRQFNGGRKLCKTHQNVLVYIKGDPKKTSAL